MLFITLLSQQRSNALLDGSSDSNTMRTPMRFMRSRNWFKLDLTHAPQGLSHAFCWFVFGLFALWLFSSIMVARTCTEEWEYRAINRLEQLSSGLPRGPMLDSRDFAVQLFASLFPYKRPGAAPSRRTARARRRGEIARPWDPHCERRIAKGPVGHGTHAHTSHTSSRTLVG
jgi:hypothetical protein